MEGELLCVMSYPGRPCPKWGDAPDLIHIARLWRRPYNKREYKKTGVNPLHPALSLLHRTKLKDTNKQRKTWLLNAENRFSLSFQVISIVFH